MGDRSPRLGPCTRRRLLAFLAGAGLAAADQAGIVYPPEVEEYLDPATELPVVRLTSPQVSSYLPVYGSSPLGRNNDFLIYCSDRSGSWQCYRLDFKTAESRAITAAPNLDREAVCLSYDERSICYFDGGFLRQTFLSGLRTRILYQVPEGWSRSKGLSLAVDGLHAAFIETQPDNSRLRLLTLARASAATVAESRLPITAAAIRPRRTGILYRRSEDELWLVHYDGSQNRRLKTAPGRIGPVHWSSDGRSFYYLRSPDSPRALHEIREHIPDSNTDQLIAPTSQFVSFSANRDGSVFAGASGSKASPYLLVLLRATRRELTLCEHRSSQPESVSPVFSHNSQRIYFVSDRHGKPAIYMMRVDRFIEKTET